MPSSAVLPSQAAALTSLLLLMSLLDFDIILAALMFMADGMLSFTSYMLNGLLRESVLLAETLWIASFTGEPCAIVLIRPSFISAFFGRSESHLLFPSQS